MDANPKRGDISSEEDASVQLLGPEGEKRRGGGEVAPSGQPMDEEEIARKIKEFEDRLSFCLNFIEHQRVEDNRFVENFDVLLSEMKEKVQESTTTLDSQVISFASLTLSCLAFLVVSFLQSDFPPR